MGLADSEARGGHCVRIDSHGGGLDGWNWLADWVCQVLCED